MRARTSTDAKQAADYIEAVAQSLRAGGVTIRSGPEVVALRMGDRVEFHLEAGEEGRQSVVHLSLRWETPAPEERLDINPGVTEQPGPPAPAPHDGGPRAGRNGDPHEHVDG